MSLLLKALNEMTAKNGDKKKVLCQEATTEM